MRVLAAAAPVLLLATGVFFACGGSTSDGAREAGTNDSPSDTRSENVLVEDGDGDADGGINCTFIQQGKSDKVDPVDFCVLEGVLENQQMDGFTAKGGTYSSWNYETLNPDKNSTGMKIHDVHDDASYGASSAAYHNWAVLYADPQLFDADLEALAPILEAELATLPQEYDGELYFNLRYVQAGLNALADTANESKIKAIADKYARQIYSSFYFDLPHSVADGGTLEAGGAEAGLDGGGGPESGVDGGTSDAGGDPRYPGDGIIGVNQLPSTGIPGILYEPASVAGAAYALIDLARQNPADADFENWLTAARKALDHLHDRAREPVTGLYYASLLTTGGASDTLGPLSTPTNLLSTDVQATLLLYLLRAQQLVVNNTEPVDGGFDNPDVAVPLDAAETGTLKGLVDFPFLPRTTALLSALQFLWDGAYYPDGGTAPVPKGDTGLGGFMDGYIPSPAQLVNTKSTHPNAYMFAVLRLQFLAATGPLEGTPPTLPEDAEEVALRALLSNLVFSKSLMAFVTNPAPNQSFLSVVTGQEAYFDLVTQSFNLSKNTSEDPTAESYTASAIAAVVQGFDTQLIGFTP
jgi:hypothetical protein